MFPEWSLTGYEIEVAEKLAFSELDSRLTLVDAASSHSITIVVGAPARIEIRLHSASFIFRADRATTLYTKRRLGVFGESARCDGEHLEQVHDGGPAPRVSEPAPRQGRPFRRGWGRGPR